MDPRCDQFSGGGATAVMGFLKQLVTTNDYENACPTQKECFDLLINVTVWKKNSFIFFPYRICR